MNNLEWKGHWNQFSLSLPFVLAAFHCFSLHLFTSLWAAAAVRPGLSLMKDWCLNYYYLWGASNIILSLKVDCVAIAGNIVRFLPRPGLIDSHCSKSRKDCTSMRNGLWQTFCCKFDSVYVGRRDWRQSNNRNRNAGSRGVEEGAAPPIGEDLCQQSNTKGVFTLWLLTQLYCVQAFFKRWSTGRMKNTLYECIVEVSKKKKKKHNDKMDSIIHGCVLHRRRDALNCSEHKHM